MEPIAWVLTRLVELDLTNLEDVDLHRYGFDRRDSTAIPPTMTGVSPMSSRRLATPWMTATLDRDKSLAEMVGETFAAWQTSRAST